MILAYPPCLEGHVYCLSSTVDQGHMPRHRTYKLTIQETQQIQDIRPTLALCWPFICNAGPTSSQHWMNVWRLSGRRG